MKLLDVQTNICSCSWYSFFFWSLYHIGNFPGNNINGHPKVVGHKDFGHSPFTKQWNDPSEIPKAPKWKETHDKCEIEGSSPNVALPKYLSLEPSLAMDWLEISWDELEIKERIGAGTSFLNLVFSCRWFRMKSNPIYSFTIRCLEHYLDLQVTVSIFFLVLGSFGTVYRAEWNHSVSSSCLYFLVQVSFISGSMYLYSRIPSHLCQHLIYHTSRIPFSLYANFFYFLIKIYILSTMQQ